MFIFLRPVGHQAGSCLLLKSQLLLLFLHKGTPCGVNSTFHIVHQGLCCYFLQCLSPGFLDEVAAHSQGLYGGYSFWTFFLVGQLCLGQIISGPLPPSKNWPQRLHWRNSPQCQMSDAEQTCDGISRVYLHCNAPEMVYRQDKTWRQIHRPTNASQMLGGLISASKPKIWYLQGSWFWVFCVPCLSEAGWSGLP